MINLLPPDIKQTYRYGLANVTLMRWLVASFVAFLGVGVIATYGWLSLHQDTVNYQQQVASTQTSLTKQHQKQVYAQVQDISGSFRLVVQVLSQEVLFSKLLTQIATTMPAGSYLTGLDIPQTQGGLDVSAAATDYHTATQVQVNLADPHNQIFAKADIVNIQCSSTINATDHTHPCTVNIRALFAQNNPFLFINQKAAGS